MKKHLYVMPTDTDSGHIRERAMKGIISHVYYSFSGHRMEIGLER